MYYKIEFEKLKKIKQIDEKKSWKSFVLTHD